MPKPLQTHLLSPATRAKLESLLAAKHAATDAAKAADRQFGPFSPAADEARVALRAAHAALDAAEAEAHVEAEAVDAPRRAAAQARGAAVHAQAEADLRRAAPAVVSALVGSDEELPGRHSVLLASGRGEPLHFEGGKAVLVFGWDRLPASVLTRFVGSYAARKPGVKRNNALSHLAGQPAKIEQSRSGNAWCVRLGRGAPLKVVPGRMPGKPSLPTTTGGASEHYVSLV